MEMIHRSNNQVTSPVFYLKIAAACLWVVFASNTGQCRDNAGSTPSAVVVGNVRVQLLSDSLVRLELKGPEGFENRTTFHIVNRDWPGTPFTTDTNAGQIVVRTANYIVRVPQSAAYLNGVRVESPAGQTLYQYDGRLTNNRWLPGPEDKPQVWWFADTPRIVPPSWGLTPAP